MLDFIFISPSFIFGLSWWPYVNHWSRWHHLAKVSLPLWRIRNLLILFGKWGTLKRVKCGSNLIQNIYSRPPFLLSFFPSLFFSLSCRDTCILLNKGLSVDHAFWWSQEKHGLWFSYWHKGVWNCRITCVISCLSNKKSIRITRYCRCIYQNPLTSLLSPLMDLQDS